MYNVLLSIHSLLRWLVLASILYAFFASLLALFTKRLYSKTDRLVRTLVITLTHIQFLIGLVLYFAVSPITRQFMKAGANGNEQMWFFGVYHIGLMFIAVGVITVGGSRSKRATLDRDKFRLTVISFGITLLLMLLAIPWFRPFVRGM